MLIIEKHATLADLMLDILKRETALPTIEQVDCYLAAMDRLPVLKPDVIILDLDLPDICGLEAIPLILSQLPAAHIILLSDQEEHRYAQAAEKLGARACIRKDLIATDLIPVVTQMFQVKVQDVK